VRQTRTITALFTDVVGSTELLTSLGPQEAERLRHRHFADMRGALAVHRGQEVKTLGDGFMAVFDSASDAVSCAVTMQQATTRHGGRDGAGLRIRVGLSAGEAAEEEGDYFGVPVVEASRLCAAAGAAEILAAEIVRLLVGSAGIHRLEPVAPMELKGLPEPLPVCRVVWDAGDQSALRVAIADDSVLLRQGIAHALESEGIDVVLQASDAESLLESLAGVRPHVVVLDVRMPPTHTTEGLDAAQLIRADYPGTAVLVLSADTQASAARQLLSGTTEGVGYLLKDRVGDIADLAAAIRTVASGGSAIDPEVVAQLAVV
jgi:class 3 adenylate cyclase/CheY-like chemotaxis protein